MTTEQALEVLKEHRDILLTTAEFTKAITIAIEVMEGRKDEMMLMYEAGWNDAIEPNCSYRDEYHYNSLTNPPSVGY